MSPTPDRETRADLQSAAFNQGAWTPGPWRAAGREIWVYRNGFEAGMLCRSAPEQVDGSTYDAPISETLANARLIAAAPDLYEALTEAMDALLSYDGWTRDPTDASGWDEDCSHDAYMLGVEAKKRARGDL